MGCVSFLEVYREYIVPKLQEIDIFLKSSEEPLRVEDVAEILNIDGDNLDGIMVDIGISEISRAAFIEIMKRGDSHICRLFRRETEIGSPPTYTHDQIAYIYNLDKNQVKNACKKLKIGEATAFTMPMVFAEILV